MRIHHKLAFYFTCISLCTTHLYSQECTDYAACDEEDCGAAYYETTRSAHWSAYVPVGILIGAAIWLGFKDREHSGSSNGHYDILGANSNSSTIFGSSSSVFIPPNSSSSSSVTSSLRGFRH